MGQQYFNHLSGPCDYSSNTGILKCPDLRLKTMFIQGYFSAVKTFSNPEALHYFKTVGQGAYCPDLLAEQFNYHKICRPTALVQLPDESENLQGFVHLLSFEKYLKMPIILNVLKTQFPEYYTKTMNKWKELDFSIAIEECEEESIND